MFFGLLLMLLDPIALVPLIAIPGYIRLAAYEETLLIQEFGEAYIHYKRRTGRFIPRLEKTPRVTARS